MKNTTQLIVLAGLGLFASATNADLIPLGETGQAGSPAAEASLACDMFGGDYCDLIFDFKDSYDDGTETGLGAGTYSVDWDFATDPAASALVDWNLAGTLYGLFAIAVKEANEINWYGLTDDMRTFAEDMRVYAPDRQTSISHITFFVKEFAGGPGQCLPGQIGTPPDCEDPPVGIPEPGTLGLLGLGLLGFSLGRRRLA